MSTERRSPSRDRCSLRLGARIFPGAQTTFPRMRSVFSRQSFKESLSLQLIDRAFVEIPVEVGFRLGSGGSLRNHLQGIAQALMGHPRREGETRGKILIGFFNRLRVFLLQPLSQHRNAFLLAAPEQVGAFGVGLLETFYRVPVLIKEGERRCGV